MTTNAFQLGYKIVCLSQPQVIPILKTKSQIKQYKLNKKCRLTCVVEDTGKFKVTAICAYY